MKKLGMGSMKMSLLAVTVVALLSFSPESEARQTINSNFRWGFLQLFRDSSNYTTTRQYFHYVNLNDDTEDFLKSYGIVSESERGYASLANRGGNVGQCVSFIKAISAISLPTTQNWRIERMISKNSPPNVGDIIMLNDGSGGYGGHVAAVLSVGSDRIGIVDQNYDEMGSITLRNLYYGKGDYYTKAENYGVLR